MSLTAILTVVVSLVSMIGVLIFAARKPRVINFAKKATKNPVDNLKSDIEATKREVDDAISNAEKLLDHKQQSKPSDQDPGDLFDRRLSDTVFVESNGSDGE